MNINEKELKEIISRVVEETLKKCDNDFIKEKDDSGICLLYTSRCV